MFSPRELRSRLGRAGPRVLDFLALIGGALLPLAFAPFKLLALAIAMPALLFALWHRASAGRAAWRGFLFGLGMFGVGTSWVYVSLHNYGNMPVPLAALTVLLFTAALAGFPALAGWLQARFIGSRDSVRIVLLMPALWVLCEWMRGWFLTGFPWLHLGYSQIAGPLSGFAPWLGVYGVSWATALSAGLVVQGLRDHARRWTHYFPALCLLWVGGWLAGTVEWTRPIGDPIRVALVQGNVPLEIKWLPNRRRSILERYIGLSRRATDVDLVIWPEAAMPAYLDQIDPTYLSQLRRQAANDGADFLIGVVERDRAKNAFYNSVIGIGSVPGIYRKQHLVPLGEFLPLKSVFGWLLDYLDIPMSDFTAGSPDQRPLHAAGQAIAVSICYEDAFGEEIIRPLPDATLLVNVSEDAWFGDSFAPHQRLQMARMRALETGRAMLRVANTGLSAVIDPRGNIVGVHAPQFIHMVFTQAVQPMQGATPYVRFGNWLVVSIIIITVMLEWVRQKGLLTSKIS